MAKQRSSSRVQSLDAFRGLCITIMIFVNYGGGGDDTLFWLLTFTRLLVF
jgi:predicted acyltransferase